MVFKRRANGPYYYRFMRNGVAVYVDTKQRNKTTAEELESAHRTRLAKGEAGLRVGMAPTLKQFEERFSRAIKTRCAEKPRTIKFYLGMYKGLLAFTPLANARLDRINEALIERFVEYREAIKYRDADTSRATVNRHLATLRRALRLAQEWEVINRVPRIRLLTGERTRDFVLQRKDEQRYLDVCLQPLKDVALLILDTGLRVGEALALTWGDVTLSPAAGKKFGFVQIRKGKTNNAKRAVSLTPRATQMLTRRKAEAVNEWVFPGESLEWAFKPDSLTHQHVKARVKLGLSDGFVLHSLRHTMLTRMGEAGADAFTIMRIAGHSSITVSQRYVHPSDDAMELAFEKLGIIRAQQEKASVENGSK